MWEQFWAVVNDPKQIIEVGGLILVILIVFAETGIFFCFFLPGDYLLFLSGVFCSSGVFKVNIIVLMLSIIVAAILGNFVGYYFGKSVGRSLYQKKESFFFKRKHVEDTEAFFNKNGGMALVMARFLPVMRTFTPIVAGIIRMDLGKFTWFVSIGAIAWTVSMTLLGFVVGELFPAIIHYLHWIIIGFVAVTTVVTIISYRKMAKQNKTNTEASK